MRSASPEIFNGGSAKLLFSTGPPKLFCLSKASVPLGAPQRTVAAADLEGERLVVMKEGHCLGDQVLGFCGQRDVKPKISFRSAQLETIQALVAAGLGLSLIPAMAARGEREVSPEYRSLQSPKPRRKIVAAWPKQRQHTRAASEFLKMVEARFGKSRH